MEATELFGMEIKQNPICRVQQLTYYYAVIFVEQDMYTPIILSRHDFFNVLNEIHKKYFGKPMQYNERDLAGAIQTNKFGCIFRVAFCHRLSPCILSTYSDPLLNKFNQFHDSIRTELSLFLSKIRSSRTSHINTPIRFTIEKPYCQWYDDCLFMSYDSKQYSAKNVTETTLQKANNYFINNNIASRFAWTRSTNTSENPTIICSVDGSCSIITLLEFYYRISDYVRDLWKKHNYTSPLPTFSGFNEIYSGVCLNDKRVCHPLVIYLDSSGVFRAQQNSRNHFIEADLNVVHKHFAKQERALYDEMFKVAKTKPMSVLPKDAPGFTMALKSKILHRTNISERLADELKTEKYVIGTKAMSLLPYTERGYANSSPIEFIFSKNENQESAKQQRTGRSINESEIGVANVKNDITLILTKLEPFSALKPDAFLDDHRNICNSMLNSNNCKSDQLVLNSYAETNNSSSVPLIILGSAGILFLVAALLGQFFYKNSAKHGNHRINK